MRRILVTITLFVLCTIAQAQVTQPDIERRGREAALNEAVIHFGRELEKELKISFNGQYPKTKLLWTRDEIRHFPRFWNASYSSSTQVITLSLRLEKCDPNFLFEKIDDTNKNCNGLRGIIAHGYGYHYVAIRSKQKMSWLMSSHPLSILSLWNAIWHGEQHSFARRFVNEGIAESFKYRFQREPHVEPQADAWFTEFGSELPLNPGSSYMSRYAWIGGRIIVEPVLRVNFHQGLECLFNNPLSIDVFNIDETIHMKTDSLLSYRKRMIDCAQQ
jgi:hypothetical protein